MMVLRSLEQLKIIGKTISQYPVSDFIKPEFSNMLQPWVVSELNNEVLKQSLKETFRLDCVIYNTAGRYQ